MPKPVLKRRPKHPGAIRRAAPHFRNAAPPRPSVPRSRSSQPAASTTETPLGHLVHTLGGALVGSLGGALATRWGFHPEMVSAVLGVGGSYMAWRSDTPRARSIAAGAASAGGSQYLLLRLSSAGEPAKPAAPPPSPTPSVPPRLKNADLGALPPGMLDAAFERARAELAVASEGYPLSHEHEHSHSSHLQ
ncbi:MAG TPA: hypothetical protein VFT22_15285 [Kofleriaceae bacterium]|nr:hypothetical protein [Kofleriaceae bacterium]